MRATPEIKTMAMTLHSLLFAGLPLANKGASREQIDLHQVPYFPEPDRGHRRPSSNCEGLERRI